MKQETFPRSQPSFEHMVTYDYRQTARNLGVPPEAIVSAINKGLLPATKVSTSTILVGNQDLMIFLKRYADYKKAYTEDKAVDPIWRDAEVLVQPAKRSLARCQQVEEGSQKGLS